MFGTIQPTEYKRIISFLYYFLKTPCSIFLVLLLRSITIHTLPSDILVRQCIDKFAADED